LTKLRDDGTRGLTRIIIGAGIEVHRRLGPGLLEKTYEVCFAAELAHRGITVECQVPLPVVYRDIRLDCGYRIDMLVANTVVVELKVVEKLAPVHVSQVLTYLRLSDRRVGLLFNFNVRTLAAGGFKRILFAPFDPSYPS
jgi:GxxExxY protein